MHSQEELFNILSIVFLKDKRDERITNRIAEVEDEIKRKVLVRRSGKCLVRLSNEYDAGSENRNISEDEGNKHCNEYLRNSDFFHVLFRF